MLPLSPSWALYWTPHCSSSGCHQKSPSLISSWHDKHEVTKRELLSLIGKLSFATKVVPARHLFLCRLIHFSTTVRRLHPHIHLNNNARADHCHHLMAIWCPLKSRDLDPALETRTMKSLQRHEVKAPTGVESCQQ